MFDQIISKYGATATAKLSSPAITGAPEDNIRAPLEELITALAKAAGQQPGWVMLVGESTLSALGTRPDYAVTVRSTLTGFIELKAPGNPPYKEKAKGRGGWVEAGSPNRMSPMRHWDLPPEWGQGAH